MVELLQMAYPVALISIYAFKKINSTKKKK